MLKKIKIIFIDLDGTLLDIKKGSSHDISEKNLQSIEKMQRNGVEIVISTGRYGLSAQKYLSKIHYNYAVTGNGSAILKGKECVFSILKDKKDTIMIRDFVKKNKMAIKFDDQKCVYGSGNLIQNLIAKSLNFKVINNYDFNLQKGYHKTVIWGKRKSKIRKLQIELEQSFPHLSIVSSTKGWTLEITSKKATKGIANLYVANNFFKINKKNEMLHIGDSMNDSTCVDKMITIAMKNSVKDFLNMADYIGPDYKNGGVSEILEGNIIEI